MNFKDVAPKYRPIPFWSWNERLNTKETKRQAAAMHQVGMGGYFMHARGGLQTPYMGQEWFENIKAGIESAKELGMQAWAYDENGWPSGFGDGKVNGKGLDYLQKYLRMEDGEKHTSQTIVNQAGKHFYYEVNPFYVDTLNEKVTRAFLEEIYQPYYEAYGNEIAGFFTDEPQISRNGIPWSSVLPDAYRKAYGQELLPRLQELFEPVGEYKITRIRFWKLVTDLFSNDFVKPIYQWCDERGLKLTGHLVLEEHLECQITSNGACMPHYEYFHIPGVDWLGRQMTSCLGAIQACSVAQQLGKKQFLTESYALCGHNVSFSQLRGILEWQMVRGVNLLCPHLEGYSLRGLRKRDYPPAMYEQQPWWQDYSKFIQSMSRIGMILAEGTVRCDCLVIHPQTTAWSLFDCGENRGLQQLEERLFQIIHTLDKKHILFHLGDETVMERHARVENGTLIIGRQRYNKVIILEDQMFLPNTEKLLKEYRASGGAVCRAEDLEAEDLLDHEEILYTARYFDQGTVYYFVNVTGEKKSVNISKGAKVIDSMSGEVSPFCGHWDALEYDSLLVLDDGTPRQEERKRESGHKLDLSGEWTVAEQTYNALTLDRCDYYFDGQLQERNGYVLNIQNRACALERPVQILQRYTVEVEEVPDTVFLACETPDLFEIRVNGKPLKKEDCGYFRDRAFRLLNLQGLLQQGENQLEFTCCFQQSEKVYEALKNSLVFESEKNKLTYDMEIEPIYLVGDFAVMTKGSFQELERDAVRYSGSFSLGRLLKKISLEKIERQGYPFFSGELTVEKELDLERAEGILTLERQGINAVRVQINDSQVITSIWNGESMDVSQLLRPGKNKIRLTLVNNLRNLLGPHHLEEGESYSVGPGSFFQEPCVFKPWAEPNWNGDYCFVKTGILAGD